MNSIAEYRLICFNNCTNYILYQKMSNPNETAQKSNSFFEHPLTKNIVRNAAVLVPLNLILAGLLFIGGIPPLVILICSLVQTACLGIFLYFSRNLTGFIDSTIDIKKTQNSAGDKEGIIFTDSMGNKQLIDIHEMYSEIIKDFAKKGHCDLQEAYEKNNLILRYSFNSTANAYAVGPWPGRSAITIFKGLIEAIDKHVKIAEERDLNIINNGRYGKILAEEIRENYNQGNLSEDALLKLKKDCLKAILYHETGHIANRDTLLNIYTRSILNGIYTAGSWIFHKIYFQQSNYSRDKKMISKESELPRKQQAFQLLMELIGYCTSFVSGIISRKCEHEADKCAQEIPGSENSSLRAPLILALNAMTCYTLSKRKENSIFYRFFSPQPCCQNLTDVSDRFSEKMNVYYLEERFYEGACNALSCSSHPTHLQRYKNLIEDSSKKDSGERPKSMRLW